MKERLGRNHPGHGEDDGQVRPVHGTDERSRSRRGPEPHRGVQEEVHMRHLPHLQRVHGPQKGADLFCLVGKSRECQQDELGCICPDCPVTAELDLKNTYYCTQGSEKEMRRSEAMTSDLCRRVIERGPFPCPLSSLGGPEMSKVLSEHMELPSNSGHSSPGSCPRP